MIAATAAAIVLVSHGTVESLDDLPAFLANIRRGHAPPPELVHEVRRRYQAIGGQSPLNTINRALAAKLEAKLGLPTRLASRLFHPYPKDVVLDLARSGVRRIVSVPLAQHSGAVYGAAMRAAVAEVDPSIDLVNVPNWGRTPELTAAFAQRVREAVGRVPVPAAEVALLFTAHSLPVGIVKAGDPYETELRASVDDIVRAVSGTFAEHAVAFQSQGIGTGMEWLGPDLHTTLRELAGRGRKHVVLAPVGFLADHVEILYDLDIEAQAWARELGVVCYRSASLNDGEGIVQAIAAVVGAAQRGG